jgi:four helix bundle protein
MTVRSYRDLQVWQKGIELTTAVYEVTRSFPDQERFGLTSQIQRAAVSIPSNIAEGHIQTSDAILTRYLYTALGSTAEVDTQLYIAHLVGYLSSEAYAGLHLQAEQIMKMLHGFINTIHSRSTTPQH